MKNGTLRIGTRGSDLALWQARHVQKLLGSINSEIIIIKTEGDTNMVETFEKLDDKGFFTKEIEAALLEGSIDVAVHSLKDLPVESPPGLTVAAIPRREDPADLLLIRDDKATGSGPLKLEENALVGTSSSRRRAQLLNQFPSAQVKPLRGNVPTRIDKLKQGLYDAIVLASAGCRRIDPDLEGITTLRLDPEIFAPAPGQGALGLQVRENDREVFDIISSLNDPETEALVAAERAFLSAFGGGCHIPLGAHARWEEDSLFITGFVAGQKGEVYRGSMAGSDPHQSGSELAGKLMDQGAQVY